jgi:hypothetical protein
MDYSLSGSPRVSMKSSRIYLSKFNSWIIFAVSLIHIMTVDSFEKSTNDSVDDDYDDRSSIDGSTGGGGGAADGATLFNSLRFRDIRSLDFHYNPSLDADIIIRRHCVIMIFDPIRALIMADRVILIVPPDAENLVKAIDSHLHGEPNSF